MRKYIISQSLIIISAIPALTLKKGLIVFFMGHFIQIEILKKAYMA